MAGLRGGEGGIEGDEIDRGVAEAAAGEVEMVAGGARAHGVPGRLSASSPGGERKNRPGRGGRLCLAFEVWRLAFGVWPRAAALRAAQRQTPNFKRQTSNFRLGHSRTQ